MSVEVTPAIGSGLARSTVPPGHKGVITMSNGTTMGMADVSPGKPEPHKVRSDKVATCYADGIANVSVGPAVSKLELFCVVPGDQNEARETVLVVAMPTAAFVEACINVLRNLALDPARLVEAANTQTTQISNMLSSVRSPDPKS